MRGYFGIAMFLLFMLAIAVPSASTQQSEYPIVDKVAQKIIDKSELHLRRSESPEA